MELELYRAMAAGLLSYSACRLLLWLWVHCLRRPTDLWERYTCDRDSKTAPCWAVVTGGTRGIGQAFARRLAARGFSILLVGRASPRLDEALADLRGAGRQRGVRLRQGGREWRCEKVEVDFASSTAAAAGESGARAVTIRALVTAMRNKDVAILVNNVGATLGPLAYFTAASPAELAQLSDVNIRSALLLTRLVLPGIVDRGSGAVVNLSSLSAFQASPMLSAYAATKAFVHSLSRSLAEEVSEWPRVDVLSVAPGFVDTDLARELFGSAAAATTASGAKTVDGSGAETFSRSSSRQCCRCPPAVAPEGVAASVLRQLGNGWSTYTFGHWKHSVQRGLMSMVPAPILSEVTHGCMRRWKLRTATEGTSYFLSAQHPRPPNPDCLRVEDDELGDVEELLDNLDLGAEGERAGRKR